VGRGATALSKDSKADGDRRDYTQFDPETGYAGHALFNTRGGRDDDEADAAYARVDEKMAKRRKRQREETAAERKQAGLGTVSRPKIADVLAPYKAGLGSVTEDQWDAIPEVGNHALKYKAAEENFTPMPASFIEASRRAAMGSAGAAGSEGAALASAISVGIGGTQSVAMSAHPGARGAAHRKIDGLATTQSGTMSVIGGHKSVDPRGYLTSMASLDCNGMEGGGGADVGNVGDISKNRRLFRSLRESNPQHGLSWISGAKLEESVGKMSEARRIIRGACESCPLDEVVWLEALRLHPPDEARKIAGRALRRLPKSVKLWLATAGLEMVGVTAAAGADSGAGTLAGANAGPDAAAENLRQAAKTRQKMVLRRALETIPNSVKLWERAISLEDEDDDARIMLSRAVECVPDSVHMWLALARLETYARAKQVLNSARKKLPGELKIWLTAAQLEESHGNVARAEMVTARAVDAMRKAGIERDRNTWLQEAVLSELEAGLPRVAVALVQATKGEGGLEVASGTSTVSASNKRRVWSKEAGECAAMGAVECARALHELVLREFGSRRDVWLAAAKFERSLEDADENKNEEGQGTESAPRGSKSGEKVDTDKSAGRRVAAILRRAVAARPKDVTLWLMAAKNAWQENKSVADARALLEAAFEANPKSDAILLAAAKIEAEDGQYARARVLLARARKEATPSGRVWMKSALLERLAGDPVAEAALLEEARGKFPADEKLWLMSVQHAIRNENNADLTLSKTPRLICDEGLRACPNSAQLWILAARIEKRVAGFNRARSMLELARQKNPTSDQLWLAAVVMEVELIKSGGGSGLGGGGGGGISSSSSSSSAGAAASSSSSSLQVAESLMSKAIEACPSSGLLAAAQIALAPRGSRQSRALALLRTKRYDDNSKVLAAVAKMLWSLGKSGKARSWFEKAVAANADDGDAWCEYLAFETQCAGGAARVAAVVERCAEASPRHGRELWCPISKKVRVQAPAPSAREVVFEGAQRVLGPFERKS
jgi:pre-mRNA-processing factor 6